MARKAQKSGDHAVNVQADQINITNQVNIDISIIKEVLHFLKNKILRINDNERPAVNLPADTKYIFGSSSEEGLKNNQKLADIHFDNVNSDLLVKKIFYSYQVNAKVYQQFQLETDDYIRSEFDKLNQKRQKNKILKYYSSTRYRIIHEPVLDNNLLSLRLAPIDFTYVALLKENSVHINIKAYLNEKIANIAADVKKEIKCTHPYLNPFNYNPLGVEIALVTKDNYTLLRKRGSSVLLAKIEWDVSYSGYCGKIDIIDNDNINIGTTAENELSREIGTVSADPREIVFTGLHRNTVSGSIDMLGYWQTEIDAHSLVELISEIKHETTKIFSTDKKAQEPFVWDTDNIIVHFDKKSILSLMKELNELGHILLPEAMSCLKLALEAVDM